MSHTAWADSTIVWFPTVERVEGRCKRVWWYLLSVFCSVDLGNVRGEKWHFAFCLGEGRGLADTFVCLLCGESCLDRVVCYCTFFMCTCFSLWWMLKVRLVSSFLRSLTATSDWTGQLVNNLLRASSVLPSSAKLGHPVLSSCMLHPYQCVDLRLH